MEGGDSGGEGIVRILDLCEVFAPGGRILGHQTPQAGLQDLVQPLRLTVGLRVIAREKADHGPDETTKLLPPKLQLGGCESMQRSRYSAEVQNEPTIDVGEAEELLHSFTIFWSWPICNSLHFNRVNLY